MLSSVWGVLDVSNLGLWSAIGRMMMFRLMFPITVGFLMVYALAGCQRKQVEREQKENASMNGSSTASSSQPNPSNKTLLDEVNSEGKWFHAKKTRPIWARRLDEAQTIRSLEGEEVVAVGDFLCKGEAGDIWPQKEKDLRKRYTPTDEVTPDGWRKYLPHPDAQGVMATKVSHPFEVHATWGLLKGKEGDFLLKIYSDRDVAYPVDIWIVDQTLFLQTYEAVATPE